MRVTRSLSNNSFYFFLLIPAFAVWGFWQTYFVQIIRPISSLDHVHGLAMFGWCFMLIAQSFLIRKNKRDLHRAIGKLSYALVPVIVISTIMLANFQLNARGLTLEGKYVLMLQLTILIQFAVFYSLAIKNRKRADVHARYMVCTALPLLDPIFARVLMFNFLGAEYASNAQLYTFALTDLILVALVAWDWKSSNRKDVFLPMLFVLVALQLPVFFGVMTPAWQAFSGWYLQLPLS
jgi:hypothetical protein